MEFVRNHFFSSGRDNRERFLQAQGIPSVGELKEQLSLLAPEMMEVKKKSRGLRFRWGPRKTGEGATVRSKFSVQYPALPLGFHELTITSIRDSGVP